MNKVFALFLKSLTVNKMFMVHSRRARKNLYESSKAATQRSYCPEFIVGMAKLKLSKSAFLAVAPHVVLFLGTVIYIVAGAAIFRAIESKDRPKATTVSPSATPSGQTTTDSSDSDDPWSWPSALLFCFVTVTTIGYGNLSPSTRNGRIFCIFYALVGIPLFALTIANVGKFIGILSWKLINVSKRCFHKRIRRSETLPNPNKNYDRSLPLLFTLVFFALYLGLGAALFPLWESWDAFQSFYFAAISLTTIGYGDLYPTNYRVFLTILYLTVGLSLTTLLIQVLGDFLRRFHYIGRSGETEIWFGGQTMSVEELVRVLGDSFRQSPPIVDEVLDNLDGIIKQAIKSKNSKSDTAQFDEYRF